MKNPKKETRDVIAKHVRWTEALRVVRAYHPEVTIILPQEKTQIYPGDDVRGMIAPAVGVIRHALDAGVCCRYGSYTALSNAFCVHYALHFRELSAGWSDSPFKIKKPVHKRRNAGGVVWLTL